MRRAAWLAATATACATAPAPVAQPQVVTSDYEPVQPVEVTVSLPPQGSGAGSATPTEPDKPGLPDGPIVFGLLDGELALEEAWERWRAGKTTSFEAVFEIAVLANRARPVAMSDELMVIALARAVELSACDPERLGKVRLLAIAVHTAEHPEELDGELARLADVGPVECAAKD